MLIVRVSEWLTAKHLLMQMVALKIYIYYSSYLILYFANIYTHITYYISVWNNAAFVQINKCYLYRNKLSEL